MPDRTEVFVLPDPGCDCDDQFVIGHLGLCESVKMLGIITVHASNLGANPNGLATHDTGGNAIPLAEITRRQAEAILNLLPPSLKVPLFAGSSTPLSSRQPQMNEGVQRLIDESRRFDANRRLILLATGAATDIATAILADPTIVDRVEVVALAFDSYPKGTDPFNVPNDIIAWQVLMESHVPLTIADLKLTAKKLAMDHTLAKRIAATGALGNHLAVPVMRWIDQLPQLCRDTTGKLAWPIWDQAVVAHLLGYTKCKTVERPIVRDDTSFEFPSNNSRTIKWMTAIDSQALWKHLMSRLHP